MSALESPSRLKSNEKGKYESLFESCGLNPYVIQPTAIGRGGNHLVFIDNSSTFVIKVPINQHIGTVSGVGDEEMNIRLYTTYFPEYGLPTTLLSSNLGYCVKMDYFAGETVSSKFGDTIQDHLRNIMVANQQMMKNEERFIDLVGLEGLPSSLIGAFNSNTPAKLTNIKKNKQGEIKLLDYDTIPLRKNNRVLDPIQRVFTWYLNKLTIEHHFGIKFDNQN